MICRRLRQLSAVRLCRLTLYYPSSARAVLGSRCYDTAASMNHVSHFIADSLVPKCTSCGITLQNAMRGSAGYYIEPKVSAAGGPGAAKAVNSAHKKEADAVFGDHIQNLSDEDKALLLNGADSDLLADLDTPKKKVKSVSPAEKSGHQCLRCRDAAYRSLFDAAEFKVESVTQVLERIPENGNLVYVVSSVDFPMSLDETVFRHRPAKSMQFVFTKSDLLFPTNNLASKYGLQFFQDYMFRTYGVPRSHVQVVSGKADWNTAVLLGNIRDNTFFIGSVNSGKSTLLQSIAQVAKKRRDELPNARKERARQKQENEIITNAKSYAAARERLKIWEKSKVANGPGASFMPGFTRGIIPIELSKSTTIYDVPGFSAPNSAHLYDYMSASSIKQIQKGAMFHKTGTYLSRYVTAKEGQVATVGGLFFLQVPRGCMLQIRNTINHKMHVFSDMQKALQVWKDAKDPEAVRDLFLVDSTKTEVDKHIVPPFDGSTDLVFRGLGFINIKATGARPDPENSEDLVVFLPKGVQAISRVPISKYITKTLSGRDKRGNVLRKEKWVQQSTKEIKRYTGKEQFFAPVVPTQ